MPRVLSVSLLYTAVLFVLLARVSIAKTIKPGVCPTINVNQLKDSGDDLSKLSLQFNQNSDEYDEYGQTNTMKSSKKSQSENPDYYDDEERNQGWYLCERSCSSDDSCLSGQKCCPTSCNGTICVGFAVEKLIKPGRCPLNLDRIFLCSKIEDECDNDAQCPNDFKCCESVCGNICQEPSGGLFPLSTKPGKCPANTNKKKGKKCLNQCRNDFSCPKSMKCCMRGCDKVCLSPNSNGRGNQSVGKQNANSRMQNRRPSGGLRSPPMPFRQGSILQRALIGGNRGNMNRIFG